MGFFWLQSAQYRASRRELCGRLVGAKGGSRPRPNHRPVRGPVDAWRELMVGEVQPLAAGQVIGRPDTRSRRGVAARLRQKPYKEK